jgi:hypothetical protein
MRRPSPSSWFTIIAVIAIQFAVAAALAYVVAQGYLSFKCSESKFAAENQSTCEPGFPYPLY